MVKAKKVMCSCVVPKRSQAALEGMLVYVWSLLIILIVGGIITYFLFFDAEELLPNDCSVGVSLLSCDDAVVTEEGVFLLLSATQHIRVEIESVSVFTEGSSSAVCMKDNVFLVAELGKPISIVLSCDTSLSKGRQSFDVEIVYTEIGRKFSKEVVADLSVDVVDVQCVDTSGCPGTQSCFSGFCIEDSLAFGCTSDRQCGGGMCDSGVCRSGIGGSCSADTHCLNGVCDTMNNRCKSVIGGSCSADSHCLNGVCDIMNNMCKLAIGGSCSANSECLSGACDMSGMNGMCGYKIVTFAGIGTTGFSGDGAAATSAQLNFPSGIAVSDSGEVFIADTNNSRVRRVDASGIISTVAGGGNPADDLGDNLAATNAQLHSPRGVFVNGSDIFIADAFAHRVRKLTLNTDGTTYNISTVAGSGPIGEDDGNFAGDGGPATSAILDHPFDVFVNGSDIFIADTFNHRVRRVDSGGVIDTFAGSLGSGGSGGFGGDGGVATSARLNSLRGVFVNGSDVFIADSKNHRVRRVTDGIIDTFAGSTRCGSSITLCGDGGVATSARLNHPFDVFVSGDDLFIADRNTNRVRHVDASGIITTIAGTGPSGFAGDGGAATSARLTNPSGVFVNGSDIFIADRGNDRIRKLCANASNC